MRPMFHIDLHSHSSISDGLLSPSDLVARAASRGVTVLALTDHDDVAGVAKATVAAGIAGIRLVPGVEISVSWGEHSFHILGLDVDPTDVRLVAGLQSIRDGRHGRAERIAAELDRLGIHGALEGAARHAEGSTIIGRAHFARYIVEIGLMPDVKSVFDVYLAKDKPGYVPHAWAGLDQAIDWIKGAGGLAVIAHPARYKLSANQRRKFYDVFKALGGQGIEVVSGSGNILETRESAAAARRLGFLASCGSDFHAPDESHVDLGSIPPLPEDLTPIWEHFAVAAS